MLLLCLGLVSCSQPSVEAFESSTPGDRWDIRNGEVVLRGVPNDTLARAYWARLVGTLPSDMLGRYVISLCLFSDGDGYRTGELVPLDSTNSRWELALDTVDVVLGGRDSARLLSSMHTIIHEFGHLLTLNDTQVQPSSDDFQDDSKGYLAREGYAGPGSYFFRFVEAFWPPEQLAWWGDIMAMDDEEELQAQELDAFYRGHPGEFLTFHACTTPGEDIAESWAFFVLTDRPADTTLRADKVRFFYQFPELVRYRSDIRAALPFVPSVGLLMRSAK